MQRMLVVIVLISFIGLIDWAGPEKAVGAEAGFEVILKDAFYGGKRVERDRPTSRAFFLEVLKDSQNTIV